MLLDLTGSKLGPTVRQTSRNGLGTVHFGVRSHGDKLGAVLVLVTGDDAPVEVHFGRSATRVDQLDVLQSFRIGHQTCRRWFIHDGRIGNSSCFQPGRACGNLLTRSTVKQGRVGARGRRLDREGRSRDSEQGKNGELHGEAQL